MIRSQANVHNTIAQQILELVLQQVEDYTTSNPLEVLLDRNRLISPYANSKNKFRLLSYNILANSLTDHNRGLIPSYEEKYLEWEYRSKLLLSEIQYYSPDIICLQEVDHDNVVFTENLSLDYSIFYKQRTNDKKDGCMTLVKREKYKVLESHYLEFFQSAEDPLLNKDNVCLIVVLQMLPEQENNILIVANTHLLYNDNRGQIKITQIYLALQACSLLAEKYNRLNVNIIYTGDFNSIPQSGIYEFIRTGWFDFRDLRANCLSGQRLASMRGSECFRSVEEFLTTNVNKYRFNARVQENRHDALVAWLTHLRRIKILIKDTDQEMNKIEYNISELAQEFDMRSDKSWVVENDFYMVSAYGTFQKFYYGLRHKDYPAEVFYPKYSTFEPLFTHKTIENISTVDYAWYCSRYSHDGRKLKINSLVELPRLKQGLRVRIFPNRIYPSDHLALIVDFEIS